MRKNEPTITHDITLRKQFLIFILSEKKGYIKGKKNGSIKKYRYCISGIRYMPNMERTKNNDTFNIKTPSFENEGIFMIFHH